MDSLSWETTNFVGMKNAMANNSQDSIPSLFDSTQSLYSFPYTTLYLCHTRTQPKTDHQVFRFQRQVKTRIAWRDGLA